MMKKLVGYSFKTFTFTYFTLTKDPLDIAEHCLSLNSAALSQMVFLRKDDGRSAYVICQAS